MNQLRHQLGTNQLMSDVPLVATTFLFLFCGNMISWVSKKEKEKKELWLVQALSLNIKL